MRSISAKSVTGSTSFTQINTSGVLYGIAITPDGTSAIVTTSFLDSPKKINLSTYEVQNITGFNGSYSVAVLHNSNEALIQGSSLKRVSLTTGTAPKIISDIYSTALQGIAITADDKYAFVVGSFQKVVVDLTNDSVIQTFSAGGTSVATTSNGSRFFVTDSYNGTVRVYKKVSPTGIDDFKVDSETPATFTLLQSYPNPFNSTAIIEYHVSVPGIVKLSVLDILGRETTILVNEYKSVGKHRVTFDASGLQGGVYFYRMQAGLLQETRKFILLK